MAWKAYGIPVAELVVGLVTLRVGVPLESALLSLVGLGLIVASLVGITRPLSSVERSRPYE